MTNNELSNAIIGPLSDLNLGLVINFGNQLLKGGIHRVISKLQT